MNTNDIIDRKIIEEACKRYRGEVKTLPPKKEIKNSAESLLSVKTPQWLSYNSLWSL